MMKWCGVLLVVLSAINNFAQENFEVKVQIIVSGDTTYSQTPGPFQIHFYTEADTVTFTTNKEGILDLSTMDTPQIIELNKNYFYEVFKGDRYVGNDKFNTFVTGNTQIIRDVKQLLFTCARPVDPITFMDNSTKLSAQGKRNFQILSEIVHEYENIQIELVCSYDENVNPELALERTRRVRDSLIEEGVFPDQLVIGAPRLTDSTNHVDYTILSMDYFPCTGGPVVNFDKITNTIVETRCDSIQFIANYLQTETGNYAIIGIYTSREDPENKTKAIARAELVRKKLIEMGIQQNRLKITTVFHAPPGKNEHHDWPFYPEHFTYEIGVYVLGEY